MKRAGNLWSKIVDIENIKYAHKQAKRGKAHYSEVKMVNENPELYLEKIRDSLVNRTFTTSPYIIEERFDGKKTRTIYKLPYYPDRIVQHCLINAIEDVLTKSLIRDTFQSIKGRGNSDAAKRVKRFVRSPECPKYALKLDIEKYYPSVNIQNLKIAIRRKIKCKDTLWLIDDILDSSDGLPIGNYTSQIFGNLNLSRFDWWMKQEVKLKAYFRYCDDLLIFADSTQELMRIKNTVDIELSKIGLSTKKNFAIYNLEKQGCDFVGYVFFPNKTRLRRSICKNLKTTCFSAARVIKVRNGSNCTLSSIMAYKGWIKRSNSKRLWRKATERIRNHFPKQLRSAV